MSCIVRIGLPLLPFAIGGFGDLEPHIIHRLRASFCRVALRLLRRLRLLGDLPRQCGHRSADSAGRSVCGRCWLNRRIGGDRSCPFTWVQSWCDHRGVAGQQQASDAHRHAPVAPQQRVQRHIVQLPPRIADGVAASD